MNVLMYLQSTLQEGSPAELTQSLLIRLDDILLHQKNMSRLLGATFVDLELCGRELQATTQEMYLVFGICPKVRSASVETMRKIRSNTAPHPIKDGTSSLLAVIFHSPSVPWISCAQSAQILQRLAALFKIPESVYKCCNKRSRQCILGLSLKTAGLVNRTHSQSCK